MHTVPDWNWECPTCSLNPVPVPYRRPGTPVPVLASARRSAGTPVPSVRQCQPEASKAGAQCSSARKKMHAKQASAGRKRLKLVPMCETNSKRALLTKNSSPTSCFEQKIVQAATQSPNGAQTLASTLVPSAAQCLPCGRHSSAQCCPVPAWRRAPQCPVPGLRPVIGLQFQFTQALCALWDSAQRTHLSVTQTHRTQV